MLATSLNATGQVEYSGGRSYPITRDTFNKFRDNLRITGEIVAYSSLYPQCGVECGCATLKVRLSEKNKKYPYEYIYVAFTCFDRLAEKNLKGKISMKLKKIAVSDHSCFWEEAPINNFNTMDLPFYQLIAPFVYPSSYE